MLGQVVWNHDHGLLAKPQALAFHDGRRHRVGLACADFVGQQRIAAIHHMGNGVFLVIPQRDLRVHACKNDMLAVILAGPDRVEKLVVLRHQLLPPIRVFPYPVPECVLNGLLLLLGQGGFRGVQNALFFPVLNLYIENAHVPQVEGGFQNVIGVQTSSAVGGVGVHIHKGNGVFVCDVPFCRILGIVYGNGVSVGVIGNIPPAIDHWRVQQLIHELLVVFLVDPGRADPHVDIGRLQIFGLHLLQRLDIDSKFRMLLGGGLRLPQLFPHVAGEILVRGLPAGVPGIAVRVFRINGAGGRIFEDYALQIVDDLFHLLRPAHQGSHEPQVNAGAFTNGNGQGFHGGIHMLHLVLLPNGALGEHIGLAFQVTVLIQYFKRTEQIVGGIV